MGSSVPTSVGSNRTVAFGGRSTGRPAMPYRCDLETALHHHGAGYVVTGWLTTRDASSGFSVALLAGGRPLPGTLRFAPRPDLPAGPGIRSLGFELAIARAEAARLLAGPVTLAVGGPDGVATAEKRLTPPRWAWEIETVGERAVGGWAVDLLCPQVPPMLLLRAGGEVVTAVAGAVREDVELAPGVNGRAFLVELPPAPPSALPGAGAGCSGSAHWAELCLGDPLNPIAGLRLPYRSGRRPAIALLSGQRAQRQRDGLSALAAIEPKYSDVACAPAARLSAGFDAVAHRPGAAVAVQHLATAPATVLVCPPAARLAPAAGAVLAGGEPGPAGWAIADGLHDLPPQDAGDPAQAFPFLRPRPTHRLLSQAPGYAPVLRAPAAALDGWQPAEGGEALVGLLLQRLGPPSLLPGVLYALPGTPAVAPPAPGLAPSLPAGPPPLVSLIVPSRDNLGHLAKLVASAAALRRRYPALELVIVDNDSRAPATSAFLDFAVGAGSDWLRVVRDRGGFNFSRLSNLGARAARGAVLLFCNDDVEIGPDFDLAAFAGHLAEPDVGIAGHTLLYEDGTIQHAGVVVGAYDAADNGQTAFGIDEGGYFGLARIAREVTAVTGAFLAVRREVFAALGGFDERDFAISFNDVDLCLRAGRAGHTVLNAYCGTVHHHESVSRGRLPDRLAVEAAEVANLRRIWDTANFQDPYYSPGFDRHALPYTRPLWRRIGLEPPAT